MLTRLLYFLGNVECTVYRLDVNALLHYLVKLPRATYLSYSTPGPVSTGMGDRIGVQFLVRENYLSLTNHPGQLSLAIPSLVGTMSTGQQAVMLCDSE